MRALAGLGLGVVASLAGCGVVTPPCELEDCACDLLDDVDVSAVPEAAVAFVVEESGVTTQHRWAQADDDAIACRIVDCDPDLGAVLGSKGLPVSRDGSRLMVHNPVHLLGAEAPISMLETAESQGRGPLPRPRVDLVGVIRETLAEGQVLELGERHALSGLAPRL